MFKAMKGIKESNYFKRKRNYD